MKKSLKTAQSTLLILFVMLTTSCAVVSKEVEEVNVVSQSGTGTLETIYEFDIKKESLWFQVKSNGCTSAESFRLAVNDLDNNRVEVSLYRTKRDLCRGLTRMISISMPFIDKEREENSIIINNPFAPKLLKEKR
ncbi:hypothetical protein CXF85_14755 [Colwellia sp. 75C3]|uniref:hypothetical protein n=1 Tax=Colwellia sp. 75C3 TaxID=888425 RepID=UPI000C349420|nr:hypothetical protein [Colwellia sp. 75C3]PKG82154.1 hypothetical protein CXF85_14755 [Colwellia sp. 75C3]